MSTEDELRKAVRLALAQWVVVPLSHLGYIADAVLALPEMAALIADAERVRRVRELAEQLDDDSPYEGDNGGWADGSRAAERHIADRIRRALDGDQP